MFRFLLGFIYVLYILIKSSKSSSVLASFNETCSENILCENPLICSNTSRCICSKSSSIWNNDLNDCFYCPSSWILWEHNQCLSFAVPFQGGLSYEQANQTCLSFSAQLLNLNNIDELEQFESKVDTLLHSAFSSAITLFFRLGAWIDKYHIDGLEDRWCDENEVDSTLECVYIRRNSLKNNSLCLSRLKCDEQIPFICDMTVISEKYTIANDNSESGNQRFAELIAEFAPLALNLLGNLLGTNQQQQQTQQPQQPTPQQIIIQSDPGAAAQAASSDNTILIVGLIIGGFLLLLFICGCAGALIYLTGCLKNPSSTNQRSSVDSTFSSA